LGEGGNFFNPFLFSSLLSTPLSLISTKLIISANSRGPVLYQRERGEECYLQISMAVSKTKNLTDPKKKRFADHCDKTLSKLFNSGTTNKCK
jgi:hypothetical protein